MITEKLQVLTPTKEEYKEVVQCMLDNGNVWAPGDKDIYEHFWDNYKENTILFLNYDGNNEITFGNELETNRTTYTTQEFINKYDKLAGAFKWLYGPEELERIKKGLPDAIWKKEYPAQFKEEKLEDNNKNMNIKKFVKTLTLSKDDKLLRECGLQNDCGDFTEEAKELIINKLVEDNKAYLVEIATQLKEEDKK